MAATAIIPVEIDLPNIEIDSIEINRDGEYEIRAHSTQEGCTCRACGRHIDKRHGEDREVRLRHLSILGRPTYIIIAPVRYRCMDCEDHPTTTQQLDWYVRRSPHTIPYEHYILLSLKGRTPAEVSAIEGVGYAAVMGIIDRHISAEVDWAEIGGICILGLDEISLRKGHNDFITVVSRRCNGQVEVIALLRGRKKEVVKAFLKSMPEEVKKTVKYVCSDLYEGFINAAKEVFGKKVKIVIDRFHVAKLYRKGVDELRKQELARLKKVLSKAAYAELKGAMWALRKDPSKLTDKEKAVLAKLFEYSPLLKQAYELQRDLTAIFEMDIDRREAKKRIRQWIREAVKSGLDCYHGFIKTLKANLEDIVNYFMHRDSSGFVEGLNNKIKVIKRRCYGIYNLGHLFQRISLDLGFAG